MSWILVVLFVSAPPMPGPERFQTMPGCLTASMSQRPAIEANYPGRTVARIACVPAAHLQNYLMKWGREA